MHKAIITAVLSAIALISPPVIGAANDEILDEITIRVIENEDISIDVTDIVLPKRDDRGANRPEAAENASEHAAEASKNASERAAGASANASERAAEASENASEHAAEASENASEHAAEAAENASEHAAEAAQDALNKHRPKD